MQIYALSRKVRARPGIRSFFGPGCNILVSGIIGARASLLRAGRLHRYRMCVSDPLHVLSLSKPAFRVQSDNRLWRVRGVRSGAGYIRRVRVRQYMLSRQETHQLSRLGPRYQSEPWSREWLMNHTERDIRPPESQTLLCRWHRCRHSLRV